MTRPGQLQLPSGRVIEGTLIEPLRIRIEVDVRAFERLEKDMREACEALRQMARAAALVRPGYPFENLDKGAIDLERTSSPSADVL